MKKSFLCFMAIILPCVSWAKCEPVAASKCTSSNECLKIGETVYECGKNGCDNGTIILISYDQEASILGLFKSTPVDTYNNFVVCYTDGGDRWEQVLGATEDDSSLCDFDHMDYVDGAFGGVSIYVDNIKKIQTHNGKYIVLSKDIRKSVCLMGLEKAYYIHTIGALESDVEYEQAMRAAAEEELDNIKKALNNPTKAQTTTSAKTVEERCQEYNGGQPCSAERLACYKKGSATTWENDKCKCKDENREWKNGECVAKSGTATINDDSVCKTPLGDLAVAHSFKDLSIENCKDIEKTDKEELVESWEMVCRTGLKIVCKPYTCTDGYEPDFKFGKCVLAGQTKLKSESEQDDAKQQEIENAKKVVSEFFAYARNDDNKTVWKTMDGKFNTARLASDVTAGVVLGTVGGVVSGVVIKKKQVQKGFEALHCAVGGQPIAAWGDSFHINVSR